MYENDCSADKKAYCPQCGHSVSPDDKFCSACGNKLAVKKEYAITMGRLHCIPAHSAQFLRQSAMQQADQNIRRSDALPGLKPCDHD